MVQLTSVSQLKQGFHYAMHGGGAYKGLRQTNTLEAIEYWYRKGVRIFELDMAQTSDGDYVALAHSLNRKDLRRVEVFDLPNKCTKEWFMKQRLFSISIHGGLTPLSLESIVNLLKDKQDIIVMFDLFGLFKKNEAAHFTERLYELIGDFPFWQRILIEAYNTDMVEGIHTASLESNVILSVRSELNADKPYASSLLQLMAENIHFISYPWHFYKYYPKEISQYTEAGIVVFSRTKSNIGSCRLRNKGITVNLVANRFNTYLMPLQWLVYMSTYLKRIVVKTFIYFHY